MMLINVNQFLFLILKLNLYAFTRKHSIVPMVLGAYILHLQGRSYKEVPKV